MVVNATTACLADYRVQVLQLETIIMLKIVLISASMALGVTAVQAQTPMHHHHHNRAPLPRGHVLANGRCNGISYGTGARSCGTATGGPAGGNSSRN